MSDWMQQATRLAATVYRDFLMMVVERRVLDDRVGQLGQKLSRSIAMSKTIDPRRIRLMSISGKGGWHPDPSRRERYASATNISLLDHQLSVVRGALMLAALDTLGANPDADLRRLERRLRQLAVVAFLHDLDKDLELDRNQALSSSDVGERLQRYGLAGFLGDEDALAPDQLRFLIELVEATQSYRHSPGIDPPRALQELMPYVALADKLDGLWLDTGPKGGLDAVMQRLEQDQSLYTNLLRDWRAIDLFDPHHPFLLDELQRFLSACCSRIAGLPPLLETHQDGRLYVLLPAAQSDEIRECALDRLLTYLGRRLFGLSLNISNRGMPELLREQPSHEQLQAFVTQLPPRDLGRLFLVKHDLTASLTPELDALLGGIGLAPRWPNASGQTLTPYPAPDELTQQALTHLHRAAHLVLLLNLKAPVRGAPSSDDREQALLAMLTAERPQWLLDIGDGASRRALTALWVSALAADDSELPNAIWGDQGLLQRWLEGDGERPGLRSAINDESAGIGEAIRRHFRRLFAGEYLSGDVEKGAVAGHCLFTDEPLSTAHIIKSATGLYEVKISAFSGRDGRLESLTSPRAETYVGPVSVVEHQLRKQVHEKMGGKPGGVPTLIACPATTGLFAGLILNNERDLGALSVYDLSRQKVEKGKINYRGLELYSARYRMARFERMPNKTKDQVNLLRLLINAALRLGRPLHLFRGLPTHEPAFFHFDAMPERLAALIGGNSLRLEQLPVALLRLRIAQALLEHNGLGFEVFSRYAHPDTRLGAICQAWIALRRDDRADPTIIRTLLDEFEQLLEDLPMNHQDAPLIRLGRAAAGIQQRPRPQASANEELLVFKLCMDTAIAAWRIGQRDSESLTYAIASELETNLVRKSKAAARMHRDGVALAAACVQVAQLFVDRVWLPILHGKPPAQAARRILAAIYRTAFLTAPVKAAE